jgi:hypothetical protein
MVENNSSQCFVTSTVHKFLMADVTPADMAFCTTFFLRIMLCCGQISRVAVGTVHTYISVSTPLWRGKRKQGTWVRKEYLCDVIWENLTATFVFCTKLTVLNYVMPCSLLDVSEEPDACHQDE